MKFLTLQSELKSINQNFLANIKEKSTPVFITADREASEVHIKYMDGGHIMQYELSCHIIKGGTVAVDSVPALVAAIKKLQSGEVEVSFKGGNPDQVLFQQSNRRSNRSVVAPAELIQDLDECFFISKPPSSIPTTELTDLKALLKPVMYAVAKPTSYKPNMQGVLLELYKNNVSAIGTDLLRLCKNTTTDICCSLDDVVSCFIPSLHITTLLKLTNECKISVDTSKNITYIYGDNFKMQIKSDPKNFPPYQNVSMQTNKVISFKRAELMQDVEALMRINCRATRVPKIHLLPINKTTAILTASCDKVVSEFEINTVFNTTDIDEVSFNPVSLLDMLSQSKSRVVSLQHTDKKAPFFVVERADTYKRMHCLMPYN